MAGPLDGVRIIDLSTVISGPYASLLLADLGADVVKVEAPGGDTVRKVGPSPAAGMGPIFISLNRNKRAICIDLKCPEGRNVLNRLVDSADVLLLNMRPEAAGRVGADPDTTRTRNPRLIHLSVVGFGSDGPYGHLPAYDDVIQAAAGMAAFQSVGSDTMEYVRTVVADKTAGLLAFGAVCAALVQRERTGQGCAIEVPMFEALTSFVLVEHLYGRTFVPPVGSAGYGRVLASDRRPYRTVDGWISVVVYSDRNWSNFCELVGRSDLIADNRFVDQAARTTNGGELYGLVAEVLQHRTTDEWLRIFRDRDVPAMPVLDVGQLLEDPHLRAVDFFQQVEHPDLGEYIRARNPMRFSSGIDDDRVPPPSLGQHTAGILADLGYSTREIEALAEQEIIVVP